MRKKLWQSRHPYHCSGGGDVNAHYDFETWAEFLEEMGAADLDYNLLFRWDWYEGPEHEEEEKPGELEGRARLELHFFQQRKCVKTTFRVYVTRDQEPMIHQYISKRWNHMKKLWSPMP